MTREVSETLEPFRKYLKVLADLHLDRKLRPASGPISLGGHPQRFLTRWRDHLVL